MENLPFILPKSPRIDRIQEHLYKNLPEIEADRAELLTESYKANGLWKS